METSDYPGPPDGPVSKYFPLTQPSPEAHTFEVALVLTGTISAGTYTAGVIDFLIEALDQWSLAKEKDKNNNPPTVPPHRVLLRVIAGASGGGIDAVLAARALSFSFPPASSGTRDCERTKNPLFDLSVNTVDVEGLLGTSDLQGKIVPSLLCVKPLRDGVRKMLDFTGGASAGRDYVVDPLPVFLTFTNLGGIPYKLDFIGASGRPEYFVNHADYIRFELGIKGGAAHPVYRRMPDALRVPAPAPGADWKFMEQYLLGTSGLPAGWPAVQVSRPAGDYSYRYVTSTYAGSAHTGWLTPDWSKFVAPGTNANTRYLFLSLDGGLTNDDPIELARTWLAGIEGHNPREGANANRAVIVIDPFSDPPDKPLVTDPGPFKILFSLLGVLVQSSRYSTADLSLFLDRSVYSRYLVTPIRSHPAGNKGHLAGSQAIASSRLSAFMGYMCKQFRVHDFMLGRRNCQAFLRGWFSLPPGNTTVFSYPTPAPIPAGHPNAGELPIIPLYGTAAAEQPEPGWPEGAFDPDDIRKQLRARLRALLKLAEYQWTGSAIIAWLLCLPNRLIACWLASDAVKAINAELKRSPPLK